AVGSNCGAGIEYMIDIAAIMAQHTDKYMFIKPNAGLPVIEEGETVFKATPREMGERVDELLDIGVQLFGGCCGTTVEHIKVFRGVIDKRLNR
ncbi:MAG: 5-methyltetrahydrofolate--homocysteine methyltransferase, partial [Planctomycetes bacterium]|nr:5-methyltetrahydrofolate--homocysteine methyltransferase [Planctomycetota bacterium]